MALRKNFKSIQFTHLCIAIFFYSAVKYSMHQEHSYSRHFL